MRIKATPRAETRGATLAEGADKTVAPAGKAYHGAGPQAKRSPKDRSVAPGRVANLPKVAIDRLGQPRDLTDQSDGTAPASKIAEVWGQPEPIGWGLSSYTFCSSTHHPAMTET